MFQSLHILNLKKLQVRLAVQYVVCYLGRTTSQSVALNLRCLLPVEYYENLIKDVQARQQTELVTGLFLAFHKHSVHILEVRVVSD